MYCYIVLLKTGVHHSWVAQPSMQTVSWIAVWSESSPIQAADDLVQESTETKVLENMEYRTHWDGKSIL